jgi:hypothetical protein
MAEHRAHLMLVAERPADEPVATVPQSPELPVFEWRHAASSVSVCRMSTRALVMWGDVHRVPSGWIARCDVEQIDGAFAELGSAIAAVESAIRARLAKLTGAE